MSIKGANIKMSKTLVFGHKNPDTDTITAALSYAALKQALGFDVEAVRLGTINPETQFALDYFKVEAPRLVETVANETNEVILVDHNEAQQSVDDRAAVTITEVIDHHRVANFETLDPLMMRIEPVGCTATIILKLYTENNIIPTQQNAGLMLSAIVSDTLLFKSPTCTEQDVAAAAILAEIAQVDVQVYGLDLLKAGADVSTKTIDELITLDAKEFDMGNQKVEIAQVNVVDPLDVLIRQPEIELAINEKIASKGLDMFLFAITNILTNDSVVLVLGTAAGKVEQAYDVQLVNNLATLPGVVSRKKQIVPIITPFFE